jgi:hypothetical protein
VIVAPAVLQGMQHSMQELSRGSFGDLTYSGSQALDLAMPERTPSPAAEGQREHHRPSGIVRESIPLFTASPMALDDGNASLLDDEHMDLRQSRAGRWPGVASALLGNCIT